MGRPQEIDRDDLHWVLWERTDQFGRITFKSQDMAAAINASVYHFSVILREMKAAGRLKVVKTGKHSIKTYEVVDPLVWAADRRPAASSPG